MAAGISNEVSRSFHFELGIIDQAEALHIRLCRFRQELGHKHGVTCDTSCSSSKFAGLTIRHYRESVPNLYVLHNNSTTKRPRFPRRDSIYQWQWRWRSSNPNEGSLPCLLHNHNGVLSVLSPGHVTLGIADVCFVPCLRDAVSM